MKKKQEELKQPRKHIHVIGQTESGKNVHMDHGHDEHKKFGKQDHLEAAKMHQKRYEKCKAEGLEDKAREHWDALVHHTSEGGGSVNKLHQARMKKALTVGREALEKACRMGFREGRPNKKPKKVKGKK